MWLQASCGGGGDSGPRGNNYIILCSIRNLFFLPQDNNLLNDEIQHVLVRYTQTHTRDCLAINEMMFGVRGLYSWMFRGNREAMASTHPLILKIVSSCLNSVVNRAAESVCLIWYSFARIKLKCGVDPEIQCHCLSFVFLFSQTGHWSEMHNLSLLTHLSHEVT